MFEVKCSNCETVTQFKYKLTEHGTVIVTDNDLIEIGFYNGSSGWYIKCNHCATEISEE